MQTNGFPVQPQAADISGALLLANCGEIIADVIQGISGTAVAASINDSPISRAAIAQMGINRISQNLLKRDRSLAEQGLR